MIRSLYHKLYQYLPREFKGHEKRKEIADLTSVLDIQNRLLGIKMEALAAGQTSPSVKQELWPPLAEGFRHKSLYLLGSGPSLLDLSREQINYVQTQPTLAMNRYLPFWKLIDLWPRYTFLADTGPLGYRCFYEYVRQSPPPSSEQPPTTFLLNRVYEPFCPPSMPRVFFQTYDRTFHHGWATDLEQRLYFVRGSLSSLLNLICLLKLAPKIVLLGVDLNRGGAFYDSEKEQRPELFSPMDLMSQKANLHFTAHRVQNRFNPGMATSILDAWPEITEQLQNRGVSVVSGNPNSLLVEKGYCEAERIPTSAAK